MSFNIFFSLCNIIEAMDKDEIKANVRILKEEYPELTNEELAKKIIGGHALWCGVFGAGTGLIPGPFSWAGILPDMIILLARQTKMVLSIAYLFGHDPDAHECAVEVLGCIGVTCGAVAGTEGIKYVARLGIESKAMKSLTKKLGDTLSKIMAIELLPIAGAVVGGVFNYTSVVGVGKAAVAYYLSKE